MEAQAKLEKDTAKAEAKAEAKADAEAKKKQVRCYSRLCRLGCFNWARSSVFSFIHIVTSL